MNPANFWAKVNKIPGGCWVWTAATSDGYGRFSVDGKTGIAHRIAYELIRGPIPAGLVLDHLCRNRACVNPDHLEPVTDRINILRGISPSASHATKEACPEGHPFDAANTYIHRGARLCKSCRQAQIAASKRRVARAMGEDVNDSRHGTVTGYTNGSCRCDHCRAAWSAYRAEQRARRAA